MSADTGWIESLPSQISNNKQCEDLKINFDFSHIDCIDNYIFLWKENYSNKILRIHLETHDIQPIIIPTNIKIHSLKIISRNNKQFLLISENKLKPQIHFINVNDTSKHFPYQNFSSQIIQIEYSSIASNTIFVLTNHNFNIIGLNNDCNEIIYHDRIDVFGKHLINFCLGIPKNLYDKLLNEYNFYYGFSKFCAYFVNKYGEIYICSPIIPNKFQCSLELLDALKFHFNKDIEEEEENEYELLYDKWLNQTWKSNELNPNYATYNCKSQFIHDNRRIYRNISKLNIHETTPENNNNICTKIIMLDLDSFLFKKEFQMDNENDNDNEPTDILPIFVRIWSDHSIDIICCTKPIYCTFKFTENEILYNNNYDNDNYDAIVQCKHYLDFEKDKDEVDEFYPQKCVQILDELIIAHSLEGIYKLKMKWLKQIGKKLNENINKYFELLTNCKSSIQQIPLYKFYMNSTDKAYNAILSDLTIININSNDELIILDEHLQQIHTLSLYNINNMNNININDNGNDSKQNEINEIDIDTKGFDMKIIKPFDTTIIDSIGKDLKDIKFDIDEFPPNFDLTNPESLKWFIQNIKIKIEKEVFDKLEVGHLLMNERKQFIETQMNNYIIPQIQLIKDKINQINENNNTLKNKIKVIIAQHKTMSNKIKQLENRMNARDSFYNNNNNELEKFNSLLQEYNREYNALKYGEESINEYYKNIGKNKNNIVESSWTEQDRLHLKGKIKNKLTSSDQMIKQMVEGLKQL